MAVVIAFILISLYLPIFSFPAGSVPARQDRTRWANQSNNPPPAQPDRTARSASRHAAWRERYRCPFVDLNEQRIDPELFRSIPAELMFRFNFVPLEAHDHPLVDCRGRSQPGVAER